MSDRLAELYPDSVASVRVATNFKVPRFPTAPQVQNETTVRTFYKDRLLAEYEVTGGPDRLGVVDKLFPHSRFDAMILAANDAKRSSVSELAPATLNAIFDLAARFVDHVSDPMVLERFGLEGSEVHICFNYDRDTTDRDNAMFYDKRFHLHLNCWPASDLASIETVRFGDIEDPVVRRRIVDPVSTLAARVIREVAGGDLHGHSIEDGLSADDGQPVGLRVRLGTWSSLRDTSVHKLLQSLHDCAERAYRDIRTAFVGVPDSGPPWTRPTLLAHDRIQENLAGIGYLSNGSRAALNLLAASLADLDEREIEKCRNDPAYAVRRMSLNGLDYSVGFYSRHGNTAARPLRDAQDVTLLMQCRLFGDVGGAGLPPLRGNAAVRLDRKSGPVMSEVEIAERTEFRRRYIENQIVPLTNEGALRSVNPKEDR